MTSVPLDSTHGRQSRPWHDITAFGQHTWSDYVGRGMKSLLLDSTHGRTTSGVACHHRLGAAHTIERRWAWNNITAFGQHTRSNNVRRDMPSPPFDSTFCRTTSGVACHHRRWAAHMVDRCQAWHDITTLGLYARSDDIGCGMPSSPLGSIDGRTTSDVACHHSPWTTHTIKQHWVCHDITAFGQHTLPNDVRRGML